MAKNSQIHAHTQTHLHTAHTQLTTLPIHNKSIHSKSLEILLMPLHSGVLPVQEEGHSELLCLNNQTVVLHQRMGVRHNALEGWSRCKTHVQYNMHR